MMTANAVENLVVQKICPAQIIHANDGMCAFNIMIHRLPDIMEQAHAFRALDIEVQFGSHHCHKAGHFHGMMEDVL